jgi:two-component SAPR family response regulator
MGLAGYNPASNMLGSLDDLTIWSRTLGEEEIWSLSKDLLDLTPQKTIFSRYPLLSKIGIVLVALLFLFWLYRKLPFRTYWKQPLSPEKMKELQDPDFGSYPPKNFIQLFGDFKVVDRNGLDITGQFTPKIKQLFLLILVFSQQSKKGITTKELSDTLWPDLNYQNAKNSRGVTIRKLRLILESMEKADVLFHIDCWTIRFSGSVYCDYVECLKLLNEAHDHQNDFYADFYKVVGAGKVFKGESHEWLDVYAGNVGNNIIDILMNFIGKLDMERDHELILKLADRILITDPVNDQALSFKLRALVLQNNMNTARFTYDQYAALYHELYNEPLSMSFNDFLKS